jgi:hypothetical protein
MEADVTMDLHSNATMQTEDYYGYGSVTELVSIEG